MREAVERHRRGGTLGGHGGTRYKTKWMQEVAQGHREYWSKMNAAQEVVEGHRGGSLEIKTKWTQEVMGRLRGKYRFWNPMNAGSLGSLMRGIGGKLDIETRWAQGGSLDIETKLRCMQKVVKTPEVFETKRKNAGNWWEAQGGIETRWMPPSGA